MIVQKRTAYGSAEVSVGVLLHVTVAPYEAASLCRSEEPGEAGDAGIFSLAYPLASHRCAEKRWDVTGRLQSCWWKVTLSGRL